MGRGGRKNRKRRRGEDGVAISREEQSTLPPLDVSFWNGEETVVSPSRSGALTPPPPPTALRAPQLLASETPHDWDPTAWQILQSTWLSLQRRHHLAWTEPTPIQLQAWPVLLQQPRDCSNLVQVSPTGSGKTLAYGLPMVLQLFLQFNAEDAAPPLVGLCLVPTRELAIQAQKAIHEVTKCCCFAHSAAHEQPQIKVMACYGGVDKHAQLQALAAAGQRGNNSGFIVAATTGRLLDLLVSTNDNGHLVLGNVFRNVRMVVLDEADRMALNRDLCEQVNQILELVFGTSSADTSSTTSAGSILTVLCSATWPERVTETWRRWVHASKKRPCVVVKIDALMVGQKGSANNKPNSVDAPQISSEDADIISKAKTSVDRSNRTLLLSRIPANLTQTLHVCAEHKKARKLLTTLHSVYRQQNDNKRSRPLGIIFCATIQKVQYLAKLLAKECANNSSVIPSSAQLHSRLSQVDRERVVREFASGKVPLLLATDLAARGLDVRSVSFVVNYDFPGNLEQYVHRCGRAGRGSSNNSSSMEATATVYSFFTRNLACLAADMVALLEAGQQAVDPNLRALVVIDSDHNATEPAAKRVKRQVDAEHDCKSEQADGGQDDTIDSEYSDADGDLFQHLSAKRIVLTRASGISDPSSSDDDDIL